MDHSSTGSPRPTVSHATHAGMVRTTNEDCCGVSQPHGAFVVCDGMGGAAAGEVASRLSVATFLTHISAGTAPVLPGDRLSQAIHAANQAVFRAAATPGLEGMGTTLVAALFEPPPLPSAPNPATTPQAAGTVWIAHVGDSRCYLYRDGRMSLLTIDHSIVEQQVQAGLITREEAGVSAVRHVITRAIGSQPHVEPELLPVDAYLDDLFLLASDGLNRELSDDEIRDILSSVPPRPTPGELDAACQSLIHAANAHGGHDNITVMLLYVC